ncbi:RNA-splicing ligase RtcB [Candidatus Dependentiae bacterium HGW-Dependentiae-1]|nr:MAG: RNA-splicing ligase RtcB [Candidatus Dependentiae bacterium HGW-Dependentiae-1]
MITRENLIKIDEFTYEISKTFRADMRVPARVFTTEVLLAALLEDRSLEQLVNVATLPGIQGYAFAMPDIHQGYGFPIGGVAAMAIDEGGVISPGGIGYDINCGVRLLVANINAAELHSYLQKLATQIFHTVPSGVGKGGKLEMGSQELDKVLHYGAKRMLELGYGTQADLEFCEERGCMAGADPRQVSEKAKARGADQLGTLGSGNHFLEIQAIEEIFDERAAQAFGLMQGGVVIMIHCGSRGLGHQTCTDHVRLMMQHSAQWGYALPDRELVCAPFTSLEAQNYFAAMAAAANYGWANRHMIGHWVRESFHVVLGADVQVNTVYDIAHNIGKIEKHTINGIEKKVIMHRKGATRAFGPGRPEQPERYRSIGHPVFVPGTMGTSSFVMVGTEHGMDVAFGSCCHGAGRSMSRMQAKRTVQGAQLREQLESKGIIIRAHSLVGLAEEAPIAYKDVDAVVDVVHGAQLARKVARLRPLAVIKGD